MGLRGFWIGLLSFCLIITMGSAGAFADANTDFERANSAYDSNDYEQAIAHFTSAISSGELSKENLATSHTRRGISYKETGELDLAILDFDEALRLYPRNAMAINNRGLAFAMKGDDDSALDHFNEAIQLDPNLALAYSNRGLVYHRLGHYDRALLDLNESVRLDPEVSQSYLFRGYVYFDKGDYRNAIRDFNEAKRSDPDNAVVYRNLGNAHYNMGNYEQAIVDYTEAVRLEPQNAHSYNNLGDAFFQLRNYGNAIEEYSRAIELDPKNEHSYQWRADSFRLIEDHDKAIEDYNKAVALNPNNAGAHFGRGFCLSQLGAHKLALEDYDEALRLDPYYVRAHNGKAWILATNPSPLIRNGQEAVRAAQKAVELEYSANNLDTLAAAYAESGDFDKAIEEQEHAITKLRSEDNEDEVSVFEGRLKLYRESQPYHTTVELTDFELAIVIGFGALVVHILGIVFDAAVPIARRAGLVKLVGHVVLALAIYLGINANMGLFIGLLDDHAVWVWDGYGPAIVVATGLAFALIQIAYRKSRSLALWIWLVAVPPTIGYLYTLEQVAEYLPA